jgi:hypothetical protein
MENHVIISQGFHTLLGAFAPYIGSELLNEFGKDWWNQAVLDVLYDDQKRDLPNSGDNAKLLNSLDMQRCLVLFDLHWQRIFRKKLSIDHRTWAKELIGVRNRLAHIGAEDFSDDVPGGHWIPCRGSVNRLTMKGRKKFALCCEKSNMERKVVQPLLQRHLRLFMENQKLSVYLMPFR